MDQWVWGMEEGALFNPKVKVVFSGLFLEGCFGVIGFPTPRGCCNPKGVLYIQHPLGVGRNEWRFFSELQPTI